MSKDVYVLAEQRDGVIQKVGIELIGKAAELAADLGQQVVAVLLGSGIKEKADILIKHGANKVVVVDDPMLAEYVTEPYAKALYEVIKKCDPEIVLYGASSIGRDLAPRVSARVHTGLTADCTKLDIGTIDAMPDTKLLLMTRPAFGGNIMATIVCKDFRPQMATVRPGVMKALPRDEARKGEIEEIKVDFTPADMNVTIKEVVKGDKKSVDITEAKILISGGRGIGSADFFEKLQDLADVLGGVVSSSRANVDAGWIEKDRQVGQTGKTVRPELYMACGISGAIQHVAGMEGAEYIVAINMNDTAPIFDVADLGIVGDVKAIIPKLTEAIAKRKAEKAAQ
ncbi:MAG: electron transfer flavoprotein subunit alpha/FixB family protein [Candidatus Metalachnospira sp.]|nr:electron transfer flavoprotein subunit alpha/FixB family protein [Candidatus Metalachnospira sp.]